MSETNRRISQLAKDGWEVINFTSIEDCHFFLLKKGPSHKLLYFAHRQELEGDRLHSFYELIQEDDL